MGDGWEVIRNSLNCFSFLRGKNLKFKRRKGNPKENDEDSFPWKKNLIDLFTLHIQHMERTSSWVSQPP